MQEDKDEEYQIEDHSKEDYSKTIEIQPEITKPKRSLKWIIVAVSIVAALAIGCIVGVLSANAFGKPTTDQNEVHQHPLTHVKYVEPTCTTEGNMEYWYCEECGFTFEDIKGRNRIYNVVLDASHKFGDWQATKQATCSQKGEEIRYCAFDNSHKETREVSPLSHTVKNGVCLNCGKSARFVYPLDSYTIGQIYSEEHIFNQTHNYWHPHEAVDFTAPAGSVE